MKIDQTGIWLNNQSAEGAGLKKLQAIPSGSCWFRRCCETIVEKHVAAAAAAAAAASADKLPRGCGHFKRLKANPFNDPGVTRYFLLSSLQRLPSLRIVILICSFSVGGKGPVY
jgi:hypothetical protein